MNKLTSWMDEDAMLKMILGVDAWVKVNADPEHQAAFQRWKMTLAAILPVPKEVLDQHQTDEQTYKRALAVYAPQDNDAQLLGELRAQLPPDVLAPHTDYIILGEGKVKEQYTWLFGNPQLRI